MKPWVLGLGLSLALVSFTTQARAEVHEGSDATLRRELEGVNEQHETAVRIHVASTVIGVVGAGGLLGGMTMALSGLNSGAESNVAHLLVIGGGSLGFVNFVLVIVGVSLDLGSASHRRKLLAAHPELAWGLTPGPGDAGLGLALRF